MNLKGKKIIVTGGSRGIGAGIVKKLAEDGAQVAFSYASRAESAEQVLKSLPGSGHSIFKLDIANEESVQNELEKILGQFGTVDGLVNNAGITKDQLLLRMKTADFDDVVNTNLKGAFMCTRAVMKPMLKARSGSVVQITSVIGHRGNAGQANYAASKAGLEAFTKSIAQEVGSRGIRLNCVAPGYISTEMTEVLSDTQKKAILDLVPLQKLGRAEDIASAVAFLLSDESTYITGQTLHVNGGMYM